ncbi:MAG TPA: hypothetical protein VKM54_01145 [Myxococcota bacterium]|nr:hypothetical protein [Myxococcota bacterium]
MEISSPSNPGTLSPRHTAPPWTLVGQAIGGPHEIAGKLERLVRTVRLWLNPEELDRRLKALEARGLARARPTRLQLLFGGLDMLRFVIEPAAREYYRQQNISFGFHQCLRILDDPVSMIDPTGLLSERDTIMGHVMQVVHLNPLYDLQLLEAFPEGLEVFERELEAMVAGTHPRARTIAAVVEDPGYHARLLEYVGRYRADPTTPPLVREQKTLRADPRFAAAECQFATLPGFLAYCNRLPEGFFALVRRLRAVREFAAS